MPRPSTTEDKTAAAESKPAEESKPSAVANPPAGGDPLFASTNDDNQNTVIKTHPWTVTVAANGQMGVVSRYSSQADAEADAAARRAGPLPETTKVEVKQESELPAYLAEVEGRA